MIEVNDRVVAVLAAGKAALFPGSGVVRKGVLSSHGSIRRAVFGEHIFGKVFDKGFAPVLIHHFHHLLVGKRLVAATFFCPLKELERLRVERIEEFLKIFLHVAAVSRCQCR